CRRRARDCRCGRRTSEERPGARRSDGARRAMLTSVPLHASKTGMTPVRRAPRSLKQEYQEFILQRLEEYKNTVPRAELLKIGDEAVRELQTSAQDQYLLTEVLLLEHVDRIIARRLRLPSFPRWRQKHRALREAHLAPSLVAIAPGCLASLRAKQRVSLISDLQVRTPSGGVHVILPPAAENREVIPLAPEALQTLYRGWQVQRGGGGGGRRSKRSGFTAIKPPRQADTALRASE